MFEFLKIRATRRLEESRFRRRLKAEAREKYKAEYFSVGFVTGTRVHLVMTGETNPPDRPCTPSWALLENGHGHRRIKQEFIGYDPGTAQDHVWREDSKYEDVLRWRHRDRETTIVTNLPPNAGAEDRFWEAFENDT